ncbi:hypothetical protein MPER_06372, partial [Moniliophthora perniciosa FA553]
MAKAQIKSLGCYLDSRLDRVCRVCEAIYLGSGWNAVLKITWLYTICEGDLEASMFSLAHDTPFFPDDFLFWTLTLVTRTNKWS